MWILKKYKKIAVDSPTSLCHELKSLSVEPVFIHLLICTYTQILGSSAFRYLNFVLMNHAMHIVLKLAYLALHCLTCVRFDGCGSSSGVNKLASGPNLFL